MFKPVLRSVVSPVVSPVNGYEPEVVARVAEIVADGGTVEDITFYNAFVTAMKNAGIWGDIVAAYSPSWGVKTATGASKLYSIIGASGDLFQATTTRQPTVSLADLNGRTRLTLDGTSDTMATGALAISQPITIVDGGFEQISWSTSDRFADGLTGGDAIFSQESASPQIALFAGAFAVNNDNAGVGTPVAVSCLYNSSGSQIKVDSNSPSTGDPGVSGLTGITLGSSRTGGSAFSNFSFGFRVYLDAAVDGDYPAKIQALMSFAKDSYATEPQNFAGRWNSGTRGKFTGWQGSQIKLKVTGANTITIACQVEDTTSGSNTSLLYNIDSGDNASVELTTVAEIFSGEKTAVIALPDTNEHEVIIKTRLDPDLMWSVTDSVQIKSYTLDAGSLSDWSVGNARLTFFVGDSWMGTSNDWPFLVDQSKYYGYMLGHAGVTASVLDSMIDFQYSGQTVSGDPTANLIVVNTSVNDYNVSVTLEDFNTSFSSIVDKIRAQQPAAKIVLVQSPRNTTDGKNFDQYGPEMDTISAARDNVEYIPVTATVWDTLTWADTNHLDFASRQAFAAHVEAELDLLFV